MLGGIMRSFATHYQHADRSLACGRAVLPTTFRVQDTGKMYSARLGRLMTAVERAEALARATTCAQCRRKLGLVG